MASNTFKLTGRKSILSVDFYNPIELDPLCDYSLALIGFHTYNSIPNIEEGVNNKFYYWELGDRSLPEKIITIPTGSYEISDIESYLQKRLVDVTTLQQQQQLADECFSLKPNNNTLKCEIKSKHEINFNHKDSLGTLLGYSAARTLKPNTLHESDLPVNIVRVITIQVDCNITVGAYTNSTPAHTLFEFGLNVDPGYAIVIEPKTLIYLPVNRNLQQIKNITLKILDQNSELVNLRGEEVSVWLELLKRQ